MTYKTTEHFLGISLERNQKNFLNNMILLPTWKFANRNFVKSQVHNFMQTIFCYLIKFIRHYVIRVVQRWESLKRN